MESLSVVLKFIFIPLIVGVISTALYVLIFDLLFKKILVPWYFSQKYKSTKIDGQWIGRADRFKFDMQLKQAGDRVSGEISASTFVRTGGSGTEKTEEKIVDTNTYVFEGEIRDGFVRIIHKEKDRNSFGFGCFLLQIAGGGKILNGSVVFVNEADSGYSVSSCDRLKFKRDSFV